MAMYTARLVFMGRHPVAMALITPQVCRHLSVSRHCLLPSRRKGDVGWTRGDFDPSLKQNPAPKKRKITVAPAFKIRKLRETSDPDKNEENFVSKEDECLFTIPGSGQDASQKQRSNRQEEDDDDEGFMEGADEKLDALTNAGGRPEGYDSHSRTTGSEKTTRDADTDSVQDVESTAASDDEVKELSPEEKLRERHTREEAVQRDAARRLRRKYDFVAGRMKTPVLKMAPSTPLNPSLAGASKVRKRTPFDRLGLHPDVVSCLHKFRIETPTAIQVMSIPRILAGESFIMNAETGSGKTLSYLLPIISCLHAEHVDDGLVPELRQPRAIIFHPTMELVEQCYRVCIDLSRVLAFRPVKFSPGLKGKTVLSRLSTPVDIIITTPPTLLRTISDALPGLSFSRTSTVIVDECDTMVDKYFKFDLEEVKNKIRHAGQKEQQWVFCGATVPEEAVTRMRAVCKETEVSMVESPHAHKALQNISFDFCRCKWGERYEKTMDLLKKTRTTPGQTIIFCNNKAECDKVTRVLSRENFNCTKLHSGCGIRERQDRLNLFASGDVQILVCTDVAGRGLDTNNVSHVINFEFPQGMVEFLHRSGRVGRVGSKYPGRCTTFVTSKAHEHTATVIKECVSRDLNLPKIEMW